MGNSTADQTILWIKNNLQSDTPLRAMYLQKKSDMFVMWAEALEAKIEDGTLDITITQISATIRHELQDMGLEGAVFHMHESLPAKYKRHAQFEDQDDLQEFTEKVVGNPTNSSSLYTVENATLIKIATTLRDASTTLMQYLNTTEIEPNLTEEYLQEVLKMSYAVKEKAKYVADGRSIIGKLDHVLTLQLATSCTLNSIFDELTAHKMAQSTITSKQMGKIVSMKIKDAYRTLIPINEVQAIQQGWTGLACESCGKFRVERTFNPSVRDFADHCVSCNNWQKIAISPTLPAL